MPVTQYIGSRYVPLFADPTEWSSAKEYEPLTVVLHEGNSFTSKQFVPVGIDIDNEAYWALTGNFNGQLEQYRREVAAMLSDVSNLNEIIPSSEFDSTDTVKGYIDNLIEGFSISDWFANSLVNRYVTAEKVGDVPMIGFTGTLQGCASNGTYLYQYYQVNSTDSYIQIVDPSDASVLRTVHLPIFCGHGNTFAFDALNNVLILVSSNRRITIFDTDVNIIYSNTYSTSYTPLSQFACNNDMIVVGNTGTNTYSFYSRLDNRYAIHVGTMQFDSSRYLYNWVQDCFIYANVFYSIVGVTDQKCAIDCFSVYNGCKIGTYILELPREPEGFCQCGSYAYITCSDGSLHRIELSAITGAMPNVPTNTKALAFEYDEAGSDGTLTFGTTELVNQYIKTIDKIQFYMPYPRTEFVRRTFRPFAVITQGYNRSFVGRVTAGGIRVRFNAEDSPNCFFAFNYDVGVSAQRQYLHTISCYDTTDGTRIAYKTFSENEDDESITTKIADFKTLVTERFTLLTNDDIACTLAGWSTRNDSVLPDIVLNIGE